MHSAPSGNGITKRRAIGGRYIDWASQFRTPEEVGVSCSLINRFQELVLDRELGIDSQFLIPQILISEEHLEGPLHRARSTGSDHRIAAIHIRRRADLPEHPAAGAGAQESAEIDPV